MYSRFRLAHLPLALLAASSPSLEAEEAAEEGIQNGGAYREGEGKIVELDDVVVTAQQELKQAPGVSIITAAYPRHLAGRAGGDGHAGGAGQRHRHPSPPVP